LAGGLIPNHCRPDRHPFPFPIDLTGSTVRPVPVVRRQTLSSHTFPSASNPVPETAAPSVPMPDTALARLTDVFKMLADKSRLQIVLTLARDGERHVTDLRDLVGQSQPMVSHHLTLMRMLGLVQCNRVGQHHYYRLAKGDFRDLLEQFVTHLGDGSASA